MMYQEGRAVIDAMCWALCSTAGIHLSEKGSDLILILLACSLMSASIDIHAASAEAPLNIHSLHFERQWIFHSWVSSP
jgi:hypothetical protein